jgi:hypothetical protein
MLRKIGKTPLRAYIAGDRHQWIATSGKPRDLL